MNLDSGSEKRLIVANLTEERAFTELNGEKRFMQPTLRLVLSYLVKQIGIYLALQVGAIQKPRKCTY